MATINIALITLIIYERIKNFYSKTATFSQFYLDINQNIYLTRRIDQLTLRSQVSFF